MRARSWTRLEPAGRRSSSFNSHTTRLLWPPSHSLAGRPAGRPPARRCKGEPSRRRMRTKTSGRRRRSRQEARGWLRISMRHCCSFEAHLARERCSAVSERRRRVCFGQSKPNQAKQFLATCCFFFFFFFSFSAFILRVQRAALAPLERASWPAGRLRAHSCRRKTGPGARLQHNACSRRRRWIASRVATHSLSSHQSVIDSGRCCCCFSSFSSRRCSYLPHLLFSFPVVVL